MKKIILFAAMLPAIAKAQLSVTARGGVAPTISLKSPDYLGNGSYQYLQSVTDDVSKKNVLSSCFEVSADYRIKFVSVGLTASVFSVGFDEVVKTKQSSPLQRQDHYKVYALRNQVAPFLTAKMYWNKFYGGIKLGYIPANYTAGLYQYKDSTIYYNYGKGHLLSYGIVFGYSYPISNHFSINGDASLSYMSGKLLSYGNDPFNPGADYHNNVSCTYTTLTAGVTYKF